MRGGGISANRSLDFDPQIFRNVWSFDPICFYFDPKSLLFRPEISEISTKNLFLFEIIAISIQNLLELDRNLIDFERNYRDFENECKKQAKIEKIRPKYRPWSPRLYTGFHGSDF